MIAIPVLLHGVGIEGLPRLTWGQIEGWFLVSDLPILFILGSALVLIRATGMVIASMPHLLGSDRESFAERVDARKRVRRVRLG